MSTSGRSSANARTPPPKRFVRTDLGLFGERGSKDSEGGDRPPEGEEEAEAAPRGVCRGCSGSGRDIFGNLCVCPAGVDLANAMGAGDKGVGNSDGGGEGGAQPQPAGGYGQGGRRLSFPAHWGKPPLRQTRDLRPLPAGYGQGSSTLARWIEENLEADTAQTMAQRSIAQTSAKGTTTDRRLDDDGSSSELDVQPEGAAPPRRSFVSSNLGLFGERRSGNSGSDRDEGSYVFYEGQVPKDPPDARRSFVGTDLGLLGERGSGQVGDAGEPPIVFYEGHVVRASPKTPPRCAACAHMPLYRQLERPLLTPLAASPPPRRHTPRHHNSQSHLPSPTLQA